MGFLSSLFGTKPQREEHIIEAQEMQGQSATPAGMKEVDPICGMDVDPETAPAKSEYKGKTYYFCAPGCKKTFDADPEKYIKGQGGH